MKRRHKSKVGDMLCRKGHPHGADLRKLKGTRCTLDSLGQLAEVQFPETHSSRPAQEKQKTDAKSCVYPTSHVSAWKAEWPDLQRAHVSSNMAQYYVMRGTLWNVSTVDTSKRSKSSRGSQLVQSPQERMTLLNLRKWSFQEIRSHAVQFWRQVKIFSSQPRDDANCKY